jgi:hypothetical protein
MFLVEALQGKPRFLIAWALVNTQLVWINFYGLLAIGVQIFFLLILWGWRRENKVSTLPIHWLGGAVVFTLAVSLPVALLLVVTPKPGGGAWVAQPGDLPMFFALLSVGPTAARPYFLDSAHFVLEKFAAMPLTFWVFLGFLSGGLFIKGLIAGFRSVRNRTGAWLALLLMVLPVTIAFGYSVVFSRPVWAFKSLLGVAYLFYLWAGIGLSRVNNPWIRRAIVTMILGIALLSLVPYFTIWEKTSVKAALNSLPTIGEHDLVLYERAYMAPQDFFYRGTTNDVWGITNMRDHFALKHISFTGTLPQDYQLVDCNIPDIRNAVGVWIVGDAVRIRQEWQRWPACLAIKKLQIFENGQWIILNP